MASLTLACCLHGIYIIDVLRRSPEIYIGGLSISVEAICRFRLSRFHNSSPLHREKVFSPPAQSSPKILFVISKKLQRKNRRKKCRIGMGRARAAPAPNSSGARIARVPDLVPLLLFSWLSSYRLGS